MEEVRPLLPAAAGGAGEGHDQEHGQRGPPLAELAAVPEARRPHGHDVAAQDLRDGRGAAAARVAAGQQELVSGEGEGDLQGSGPSYHHSYQLSEYRGAPVT